MTTKRVEDTDATQQLRMTSLANFREKVRKVILSGNYGSFAPLANVMQLVRDAEELSSLLLLKLTDPAVAGVPSQKVYLRIYQTTLAHISDLEAMIQSEMMLSHSNQGVVADGFSKIRERLIKQLDDYRPKIVEEKNSGGRPPKWDWDGALHHLIGIANETVKLPTDSKNQAKIEALISEWFIDKHGEAPAESQIRLHARGIAQALRRAAEAGN